MIRSVIKSPIRSAIRSVIRGGAGAADASVLVNDSFTSSLPAGWTFTRTGAQTYEDSIEILQTQSSSNTAVFTYKGGSAQGILLEPAQTNLQTKSETVDTWATQFNTSVTSNAATAPDGNSTADKVIPNTSSTAHVASNETSSITNTLVYSAPVYAKSAGYDFLQITESTGFSGTAYANFNLATGALGASSGTTAVIEDVGNGWYRCCAQFTAVSTITNGKILYAVSNADTASRQPVYAGDGTSGIYLWGAAVVQGEIAGSYIKTTTTSASRGETSLTQSISFPANGISGKILCYTKFDDADDKGSADIVLLDMSDGTENNYLRVLFDETNDQIHLSKRVSGGTVVTASTTATNLNYTHNSALNIRFRADDSEGLSLKVNGESWVDVSSGSATSDWVTLLDEVEIKPAHVAVSVLKLYGESKTDSFLESV